MNQLFKDRKEILNPIVIDKTSEDGVKKLEGNFYRVTITTGKEFLFLLMFAVGVDRFAPVVGDGIIVSEEVISKVSTIFAKENPNKLKVLTRLEAAKQGYRSITTGIHHTQESDVIDSIEESMRGVDAVWIKSGHYYECGRRIGEINDLAA